MMIAFHTMCPLPHADVGMNFQEMFLSQITACFLGKKDFRYSLLMG